MTNFNSPNFLQLKIIHIKFYSIKPEGEETTEDCLLITCV